MQGVDVWLNNPRRGEEACGTSGMKAAINGVLNLSILDGWFDEAYETSGGWAIGEREPYSDDQDALHASAIYSLLENEIVPMFYEHREQTPARVDAPRQAVAHPHQPGLRLPPHGSRVHDRAVRAGPLRPSAHAQGGLRAEPRKNQWNARIREVWDRVRFVEAGPGPSGSLVSGRAVAVRAAIDLAGLAPNDVRAEVVIGRVDSNGHLEETEVSCCRSSSSRARPRCSPKISFRNGPADWAMPCGSARITTTIP